MTWWEWALLWTVLVLGGLALLGWLAWGVIRAGLFLLDTLAASAEQLGEAFAVLEDAEPGGRRATTSLGDWSYATPPGSRGTSR